MVNEVNKIIRNTLLAGEEGVFLPGIGSLRVERRAAVRTSRNTLEPPLRTVVFCERECGISLIDRIAAFSVDTERAHEIYNDWRVQTYSDGVLTIDGVGQLKNDGFVADDEFLKQLNPRGTAPIRINPKPDAFLYVFAALCCLFALFVAGYIWYDSTSDDMMSIPRTEHPKTAVAETIVSETPVDTKSDAADNLPAVSEHPAAEPAVDKNAVLTSTSGKSYLVLGVFSTKENALKAVRLAERNYPAADCRIYRYSDKFMVSLFEGNTEGECVNYRRTVAEFFPDSWIYNKR